MAATSYSLYGFATFCLAGWIFVWCMHLTAIVYGKYRLYRNKHLQSPIEEPLPGISILKPLLGVDCNLFTNLESFFNLKYPKFELLFCIHDESDPSVMLVNRLREKYPQVDVSVFVGGKKVGINPKINNMMPGYDAAKYELILVSDAGIKMKEESLLDMVLTMSPKVGLVHQMPFSCDRKGFAANLEKIYFGTQYSRMALLSDLLGINCCTGMSCMMRKVVLEEAGGMAYFGQFIAEDYFMAQAFLDRGWKCRITSLPALQNSGTCSVVNFQQRMMRWCKLRQAMIPLLILLEPLSECLLLGAIASGAVYFLFDISSLAFFFLHILIWFSLDYVLLNIVQGQGLPFNKLDYVVTWVFRECSTYYSQFGAIFDPTVTWKSGDRYRLRWGGRAEQIKQQYSS